MGKAGLGQWVGSPHLREEGQVEAMARGEHPTDLAAVLSPTLLSHARRQTPPRGWKAEASGGWNLPQTMQPQRTVNLTLGWPDLSRPAVLGEQRGRVHLSGKQFTTKTLKWSGGLKAKETTRNVSSAVQVRMLGRWVNRAPPGSCGQPLNSLLGGFLGCGEGLVLTSGVDCSPCTTSHDGQGVQPGYCENVGPLSCFFFFHPFLIPHFVQRVYATCEIQRKTVDDNQRQRANFPGFQGPPQLSPSPAPGPRPCPHTLRARVGKGSAVCPMALHTRGLCTACSFCQNACPQTPTCTVLCQASAQTPP